MGMPISVEDTLQLLLVHNLPDCCHGNILRALFYFAFMTFSWEVGLPVYSYPTFICYLETDSIYTDLV